MSLVIEYGSSGIRVGWTGHSRGWSLPAAARWLFDGGLRGRPPCPRPPAGRAGAFGV